MRDKRTVDELSVEELERILIVRKREARMERFRGTDQRRVDVPLPQVTEKAPVPVLPQSVVPIAADLPVEVPEIPPAIYEDDIPRFEDDLPPRRIEIPRKHKINDPAGGRRWQGTFSTVLFLVEVAAFVGLIALVFLAFRGNQTIDRNIEKTDRLSATSEAALLSQMIRPTATPLISINAVVLPGGHIWSEQGAHQFNFEEIPVAYRASFQEQLSAPRPGFVPTPAPGAPTRIIIDKINVNASIRSGDDWSTLQAAVGHHPFSSNPGRGNMVLTGHNDIFGEVFRRLPELAPGDEIIVQTEGGTRYTYRVRESKSVTPMDTWVLGQSLGAETPIATLITCYPYRVNTERWIIFAELVES